MTWALEGRHLNSVLVTRLRYLGDIVMSTVVLEVLHRGDPGLEIGYLCEDNFASVLAGHPRLKRIHSLRSPRHGADARARAGNAPGHRPANGTLGALRDLKRHRYDLAVDLFFNPRSAWLLKLAGIPLRIGGTRKWRGRLYTRQVVRGDVDNPSFDRIAPGGLGEHLCRLAPLVHVETGLPFLSWLEKTYQPGDLVPELGQFPVSASAAEQLGNLGLAPESPYVLVAPCATWESKQWPGASWASLVTTLMQETSLAVAVMVAPGKAEAWASLAALIPSGRGGVLPPLPLDDALGVTGAARALVTVDGGMMHAAVGLRVPTVALFGPTDPGIWFPYEGLGPFRVLAEAPACHPCDLHDCGAFICLPDLAPERVGNALRALLKETSTTAGGSS